MAGNEQGVKIEGHKLMYHVDEVSKWLQGQLTYPIYVEIGPINSCNHNCSFCALDYLKSKGKMVDREILSRTLKQMSACGVKSVMFAGEGEPLLYPYITEAVSEAKKSGLDVAITSNGVLLTPEKSDALLKHLSWIKISIDAAKPATHARIHGCSEKDFNTLIGNIEYAANLKKEKSLACTIGAQMLLIPENIDEVEELILAVRKLGVSYLVLKPYSQHPNSVNRNSLNFGDYGEKLAGISRKYSANGFSVINRSITAREIEDGIAYNKCYGLDFFALITATGDVIPCNLFYDKPEFAYGNIYDAGFDEIWNGERRQAVLKKIHEKGCEDCRRGCRLNFANRYLDELKNKRVPHINFI
ncbi:radical SAM protein [Candidatus Woesearchaeota archaeon]|nr:radical SAM protein [Candidatus Woesearchaeota archaeon]